MLFVGDGGRVEAAAAPLEDRQAGGHRALVLGIDVASRQPRRPLAGEGAQQLDEECAAGQVGVHLALELLWVAGVEGLGEHRQPGLLEVALEGVALGIEVVGDLGEENRRPSLGRGYVGRRRRGSLGRRRRGLPQLLQLVRQVGGEAGELIEVGHVLGVLGVGPGRAQDARRVARPFLHPEAIAEQVGELPRPFVEIHLVAFDDEDPRAPAPLGAEQLEEGVLLAPAPLRSQVARRQDDQQGGGLAEVVKDLGGEVDVARELVIHPQRVALAAAELLRQEDLERLDQGGDPALLDAGKRHVVDVGVAHEDVVPTVRNKGHDRAGTPLGYSSI